MAGLGNPSLLMGSLRELPAPCDTGAPVIAELEALGSPPPRRFVAHQLFEIGEHGVERSGWGGGLRGAARSMGN